mgnify:CR=1 FL=1
MKRQCICLPDSRRNEEEKRGTKENEDFEYYSTETTQHGKRCLSDRTCEKLAEAGHEQSVVGGVYEEDQVDFPDGVKFYPVFYHTEALPFAITGMSDEMPYESTCYKDLTSEMLGQFREIFCRTIEDAVRELNRM